MSKPFHVYLDLDVLNNNTDPTAPAPALSFGETRTQPFLDGTAEDYFVAIARFSIQTGGALPVFIPAIQTGQSNVNQTVYIITLVYNGASGTGTIMHVPQPTAQLPSAPTTVQDFSTDYYYIYNYQDWIGMVNTAFQTAFANLITNLKTASIYNAVSNQAPTPLDAFTPLATSITQVIALSNPSGIPFVAPLVVFSTIAPLNVAVNTGIDTSTTNNVNVTTRISNATSVRTDGVVYYTYTVNIQDRLNLTYFPL